jgi:hypothetical protein
MLLGEPLGNVCSGARFDLECSDANRPLPQCSINTSARMLRAEFPVQRNSTLKTRSAAISPAVLYGLRASIMAEAM